jgi:hypothetical protein
MRQSRTPRPVLPHLEPLVLSVALTARQRRTAERFLTLTLGLLQALGRHTITQVLLGLGHGARDWSAVYRLFRWERIDLAVARRELLAGVLRHRSARQPLVVVLDATQLPRSSPRFVGCGWLKAPRTPPWKPGIHRAQRWVGLSALLPRSGRGESRTVPLWFFPAPAPSATPWPRQPPCREWEAGLRALTWLRDEVDRLGRPRQRILAVADGSYGVAPLWRALPAHVTLLARCPKNRALFALPGPATPGRRGRRRLYGSRGPTPSAQLPSRHGWQTIPVQVRGRTIPLRVRLTGPWLVKPAPHQPLFLLLVRGIKQRRHGRTLQRDPTFLLVSAQARPDGSWQPPLPTADLLAWAWQRWEVEVMHRELKSGFGLGEQQAWHPTSALTVIQWVVWSYGALLLAGYRAWGWTPSSPTAAWQRPRRWTARDVASAVRAELWETTGHAVLPLWATIQDVSPQIPRARWPVPTPALVARRI